MGLLELFYGGSQYMKDKRADEKAAQAQGLMENLYGNVGQPSSTSYGGIMPTTETTANGNTTITGGEQIQGSPIPGQLQGGTGLLGGQITQPQFDARQQAGLAGIYGAEGLMQSSALQGQRGRQAMDLQKQNQQFYGQNVTAYQQAQIDAARITQGIQNSGAMYDDMLSGMTNYRADVKPYSDALDRAENTNQMVKGAGGINNLSGPEELAVLIDYARMTKPENLTAEDMDNIMASFGISGAWVGLQRKLGAGGRLGAGRMTEVVNAINRMRTTKESSLKNINNKWGRIIQGRGIPTDFRRQPSQLQPGQQGGFQPMPDDVIQVN